MNTHHIAATLAVFACALSPSTGCILEEPPLDQPIFFCTSDEDCTTSRHFCDLASNTCGPESEPPGCDDQDDDGYGCNENRITCRYDELDTDCIVADINPGAPDLCDGKDNDSDGAIDEQLDCERIADCPTQNLPDSSFFRCEAGTCVLRPADTSPQGCDITLACTDGAYDTVPEACKD